MNTPAAAPEKEEWKKEIDKLYEGERSTVKRAKENTKATDDRRNLKRHERDFVCHICGEHLPAPALLVHAHQPRGKIEPSRLRKCGWCQHWTCGRQLCCGSCLQCQARPPLSITVKKVPGCKNLDEKELQKSQEANIPANPTCAVAPQRAAQPTIRARTQNEIVATWSAINRLDKTKSTT